MRILAPVPWPAHGDDAAEAATQAELAGLPTRSVFPISSVIRVCLTIMMLLSLVAAAYWGRQFLLPTCFAIVLALIMRPVAALIERTGLGAGIAAALSMLTLLGGIVMLLMQAAPAISDFADQVPQLVRKIDERFSGVKESVAAIKAASDKVEKLADPPADGAAPPAPTVIVKQTTLFTDVATTTPGVLAQIAYAFVLAFFLLAGRHSLRSSFLRAPPTLQSKIRLARFIRDVGKGVSRYMLASACVSVGVAIVAAIALSLIGLPNALAWGGVMGLAMWIPIFGPIATFLAVACAGLIAFPTVEQALLAPGALIVIHICESQFVTPAVVGRQCALNPVIVFFTIAFMAWLWGTGGAFIAVPSLILLATAARHTPSLHWLEPIVTGGETPAKPAQPPAPVAETGQIAGNPGRS